MRFVLGIDIGGTNLVVGASPRTAPRCAALVTEPTGGGRRHRRRVDRMVALASTRIAQTRRETARRRDRRRRRGRAGPARPQERHRPAHAESGLGQHAAAPDHPRPARAPRLARQRRQLRGAGRVVGRRRPGRPERDRHHHRHRHRRRHHSRRQALPRRLRRARARSATPRIDTEGRRCKCGNYGCLEAYASGPNIALRAIEAIEAGAESRPAELRRWAT